MTQILTPKQVRFCEEYVKDMNLRRAVKASGYTQTRDGDRLMKKPHIIEYINKILKKDGVFAEPTIPRILKELMSIAFFDPAKLFNDKGVPLPLSEIDEETRRCICGIDFALEGKGEEAVTVKKYKIIDKHKALENLGRHLAMFTDKMKIDINTELANMNDEQLHSTIRSLAEATGLSLSPANSPETKH